ncbi:MAG: YbhB/YbcL family Raf kinase inhibitor-like protein [Cyanobacteria bacterium J06636_16]
MLVLFGLIVFQSAALAMPFEISSPQFSEGATLPDSMVYQGFSCDGGNQSPELSWAGEPEGTQSYVITMYDPDAPTGVGWWHWLVFNIPANVHTLPQNAGSAATDLLPVGSQQGYTDYGASEYGGACPPVGDAPHRYIVTLYALDVDDLPTGDETTGAKLAFLMRGHILAEAKITGRYGR